MPLKERFDTGTRAPSPRCAWCVGRKEREGKKHRRTTGDDPTIVELNVVPDLDRVRRRNKSAAAPLDVVREIQQRRERVLLR